MVLGPELKQLLKVVAARDLDSTTALLRDGDFPTPAFNSVMRLVGAGSMGEGKSTIAQKRAIVKDIHALIPKPDAQSYEILLGYYDPISEMQAAVASVRQGLQENHLSGATQSFFSSSCTSFSRNPSELQCLPA